MFKCIVFGWETFLSDGGKFYRKDSQRGGIKGQIWLSQIQQYLQKPIKMATHHEHQSSHSDDQFELWAEPSGGRTGSNTSFRNKNRVKWTSEENFKYCVFLAENLEILQSETLRKQQRVFARMAEYIGTRTTPQAKSHHQKMMKRHHQVPGIIDHMEHKLNVRLDKLDSPMIKQTKEMQLQTEEAGEDHSGHFCCLCEQAGDQLEEQGNLASQCHHFINMPTWFDDF